MGIAITRAITRAFLVARTSRPPRGEYGCGSSSSSIPLDRRAAIPYGSIATKAIMRVEDALPTTRTDPKSGPVAHPSPARIRARHRLRCALVAGLALTTLFLPGRPTLALSPQTALGHYLHREWRTPEGLPSGAILAMAQTRDGYIWLASQEGLARFDGVRFDVFNSANTPQIQNNFMTALLTDRDGALWIGTLGGGLLRWSDGSFTSWTEAGGLPSNAVRCLCQTRDGTLWIGTERGGLVSRKDGRFTLYGERQGLVGKTIWCLAEGADGTLWIGTDREGLSRYKGGAFVHLTREDGFASEPILSLCADAQGGLWVGTPAGVVYLLNGESRRLGSKEGLPGPSVSAVLQDRTGTIWIGTQEGGFGRLKGGAFETYPPEGGGSKLMVLSLFEDREGSLWVGTFDGLRQLVDADFVSYGTEDGLPGDVVVCSYEDRAGNLWIGTSEGLGVMSKGGAIRSVTPKAGLPGSMVVSIHEDRAGAMWFGIMGRGLARLEGGVFKRVSMKDGLICNNVMCMCDGDDGGLWAGTPSGMSLVREGTITNFKRSEGLGDDNIMTVTRLADGSVWAGGANGTLSRFKGGAWRVFGTAEGLPKSGITSIYEDPQGVLWIASFAGLIRFEGGRARIYTRKEGLFNDSIHQVLEDDRGKLWISCNQGVFSVDKEALDGVASGRLEKIPFRYFDSRDGMQSAECNGGGNPAGCKTSDGRLCFPTMRGIAIIDTHRAEGDAIPPLVALESVEADGESLAPKAGLRLGPGIRRLIFRFAALSFRAPDRVQFRYRLQGFDEAWIDGGSHREASYTNLRPGSYVFEVMAHSKEGLWSRSGERVAFELKPFFYQTRWFLLLCVLLTLVILVGANRLVIQQLRARNAVFAERNRLAREIHDTVAQGLTGVALQLDTAANLIDGQPKEAKGHLVCARTMLGDSIGETRRAIRALRPRILEEEESLAEALRRLGASMTSGSQFQVSVEVSGRVRRLRGKAAEEDLWRIAQEAIVNSLRHGTGGHIDVSLAYAPKALCLTVRDDGPGFAPHDGAAGNSHGLLGMKERASARGWTLDIKSAPGLGTTVAVTLPLPRWPIPWAI